jgi:hypothetical protein
MTTLFDSAAPVKTDRPFGTLPACERRQPYTQADLDWAAQAFADASEPDYDLLAGEAAFLISCELCGRPVEPEELDRGLCNDCQSAAEDASMASQYGAAGMQWKSY